MSGNGTRPKLVRGAGVCFISPVVPGFPGPGVLTAGLDTHAVADAGDVRWAWCLGRETGHNLGHGCATSSRRKSRIADRNGEAVRLCKMDFGAGKRDSQLSRAA